MRFKFSCDIRRLNLTKTITHFSLFRIITSLGPKLFLRGMPHLCSKMKRLTKDDIKARKNVENEPVPDFDKLSKLNPLPEVKTLIPTPCLEIKAQDKRDQRKDHIELSCSSSLERVNQNRVSAFNTTNPSILFNPLFGTSTPPSQDGCQEAVKTLLSSRLLWSPTDVSACISNLADTSMLQEQIQQIHRQNMPYLDASPLAMLIKFSHQHPGW